MRQKLTFVFDRKKVADKKKEGVIELKITAGGKRKYISTGVKVFPKEWKNGEVVGCRDWKEKNDFLQTLKRKCSEIINKMVDECNFNIDAVAARLDESTQQKQTFLEYAKECAERRMQDLAEGTRKRYKVVLDFLDKWRGIVFFTDVTERNIRKMDDYLANRGLKVCSRYNYHKILKAFVLQAFGDGLITKNPYAHYKLKRGDDGGLSRVLTPKEFERLETCIIPTECNRRVRDLFLFQTYTMMGYSDLAAFDYKECKRVKGKLCYKAKRLKTGQEFMVVLLEPALNILKKYKYKLPIISNVKYNLYLKAVAQFAKIDKPLTTHYARHTGATLLLNNGVSLHIIQHILGHATLRETERTYAKLMDETIIDAMTTYDSRPKKVGNGRK